MRVVLGSRSTRPPGRSLSRRWPATSASDTLEETVDLPVGHVVTLLGDVAHDVEAVEESAFLLTIASA